MTRVRVQPRSSNLNCCKNDVVTFLATLLTQLHVQFAQLDPFKSEHNLSQPGAHPEISKRGGGVNLSNPNQNPIVVNLFQPLMKMYPIIVKQGIEVIVAFCYNICLFRNTVITNLKVVDSDFFY